jgi:thymidylate synthase ThyX
MTYAANILADSKSSDGVRLTTFEVTFPRIVLAEFNTHRMFSRNSASSRAIPVKKMIERVMENPYIPSTWGKNQKGMQAGEDVGEQTQGYAKEEWLAARDYAVDRAKALGDLGIHKQLTNRLLEPFMWHTAIVTATEWSNFFHLRNNKDAHPDIQIPARMMQELYDVNTPQPIGESDWHLPLVDDEDYEMAILSEPGNPLAVLDKLKKISSARCARISYLTHDGKRDHDADVALHDRLLSSGHMSPFEHVARPMTISELEGYGPEDSLVRDWPPFLGNFRGWVQYRKTIPNEHDMLNPNRGAP